MVEPTEDDSDVPALFLIFVVLPVLAYFLLGKWHDVSNKARVSVLSQRAKEDAFREEIMAYLDAISPGPLTTMAYLRPTPSIRHHDDCATCHAPAKTRCSRCKSVRYCSLKCQIKHWRQGHRETCKQWHDSGAGIPGGPPTEALENVLFLSNLNSPVRDRNIHLHDMNFDNIHLHDMNFDTSSEPSFPTTDSYNLDTIPFLIERSNMNNSNQSLHTSEHGVVGEKNNYSVDKTRPSEILSVKKVSNNDFGCSDSKSGNRDVTYPVDAQQPSLCAPDTRKRPKASVTVYEPDIDVSLTSDMISSCEGTYASAIEPLQRNFSSMTFEHEALEHLLIDASAEAIMLSYAVLKDITNNFSEVIGGGGSGEVYMGVLRNGKVAVKKLYNTESFTEKQFADELTCLIRVKHNNIVRLLGYCSDTQQKVVEYNGRLVLADVRRRFLCFEYAPNKSLDDYLKDESHGHKWDTRYQLIAGICQGLHYLHKKESITHLDLKPGNILLDADMVPKITDFGISRRFSGAQSRIITKNLCGSLGYIAPELLDRGEISFKSDIFSLGVIIRNLLKGSTDLSDFENWHQPLDIDCPQFKRCIKIAQQCVDGNPRKRPTIDCIIDMLNEKASPVFGQSENKSSFLH